MHFIMVMKFHDISLLKIVNSESEIGVFKEISDSDGIFINGWENVEIFVSDFQVLEEFMFLALKFQGYRWV